MKELDKIDRRAAEATAAPWRVCIISLRPRVEGELVFAGSEDPDSDTAESICEFTKRDPQDPDADFVAHAREDVPALVREVRRLKKLLPASMEKPWPCTECGSRELCTTDCSLAPWNIYED